MVLKHPIITSRKRGTTPVNVKGLPDVIRNGEIIVDIRKKKWRIGKCIGVGAFGDIYLASDDVMKPVPLDSKYVVKVEPYSSGPLFVERNFYLRVAKESLINEWKTSKRLNSLGVPHLISFGSHQLKSTKMRFIVIPRYNESVHSLFEKHSQKFHIKTALTIAHYVVDALEYIHDHGYIHCDIKDHNLVLGDFGNLAPVYLLDFGLATTFRFRDGTHKKYQPDERLSNVGTMEFSSRDSHIGAVARRSDMESLGYNIVSWLGGRLPWMNFLGSPEQVSLAKEEAMQNPTLFLSRAFPLQTIPVFLLQFFMYISSLDFEAKPDYVSIKQLFRRGIRNAGYLDDLKLTFDSHARLNGKAVKRVSNERENLPVVKKMKTLLIGRARKPCSEFNSNARVTRNLFKKKKTRIKRFNWALILAGDPEKLFRKLAKKDEKTLPAPPQNESRNDGLSNPTPAMLRIIEARKHKDKFVECQRKGKQNEDNHNPMGLTYAMREVIGLRHNNRRVLRSSSRRSNN